MKVAEVTSDASSPPLTPILSHTPRRDVDRRSKLSRISLDRHSKSELAVLLLHEERESNKLRKTLLGVVEQLRVEAERANENERRAHEAAFRYRQIDDERVKAKREAAKASEELRLYKLQLDNAQKEILKAQSILDSLEADRVQADESAARARSAARQMKEELLVQRAREEGRQQGIRE
ncbi:hypothetical protein K488DRAFT_54044, partial [Vararia minispora EC-137]